MPDITMETVADTNTRKIRQGRRIIGFITHFPAIARIKRPAGWTFLANRKDIAARYPVPSPVFDDPKATLRHVIETIG